MSVKKNAALGFIFVTILIDVIGLAIIIPVLPKLLKDLTGIEANESAAYGGWLLFAYAVMQFLFSPVLGGLSDRYGRRPVLLVSLVGLGVDYIFHAFAPSIFWLFVGRVLAGMAGASYTTASAYIADISEPEKRAQNFGMVGAAFGMGFIIGPVIGGLFAGMGTRVPFYIAAGLSFLNAAYGYFVLPESLKKENRRTFSWKRANPIGSLVHLRKYPIVYGLIVSLTLLYIASHAIQSNWSFYCVYRFSWTEAQIGISLGFVGILIALVQGFLIRIINPKLGNTRSVLLGLFLYCVGFFLFSFATTGWMMYVILIPYCLGGISGPALQGIISNQVPDNEQGEIQGTLTSIMSLTSIIGPPLMTNLFSSFTSVQAPINFPGASFMLAGILTVLAILFSIRSLRKVSLKSTTTKSTTNQTQVD